MIEIPDTSSRMRPAEVEDCVRGLPGLQLQAAAPESIVQPHWGLFAETLDALAPPLRERIRAVVNLADPGDLPGPEKTIVRLAPEHYVRLGERTVRAIKLKGIGSRLAEIKRGSARHLRLLGRGDIPILVPYLTPAGEEKTVPFDVGEPYGAKRFRSALNEIVMARIAARQGCAVPAALGVGVYRDAELLFKGEPAGFSIWGVGHPEDERFDAQWRERFARDCEHLAKPGAGARDVLGASLEWTCARMARLLAEARRYHSAGLVHHEPQFDNHAFFGESLSVVDWEEAAHCSRLSRVQFLESVLIDLYKLVCYCCAFEDEYAALLARAGEIEARPMACNWFAAYFDTLDAVGSAALESLLPMRLHEYRKRGAFREVALPLIDASCSDLRFGDGVDWEDVARPFQDGFSAGAPRWQPEASTAFDLKLFVRKGARGVPGNERDVHPSDAIREAEQAVYQGRFAAAVGGYRRILEAGPVQASHRQYLCHNLAALCLALRRDADALTYFKTAYGG
jgi:hypothetical protein